MADQEDSEAVAFQLQVGSDDETSNTSPKEPSTSQAAKKESLRKSQKISKLTVKGQALHKEKVNKLQTRFKASYDEWKAAAKQIKGALKAPVSARLHDRIVQIQYASAELKQAYDKLRRRVDTCDAVSQRLTQQAQECLAEEGNVKDPAKRSTCWSEAGSVFSSAVSQKSKGSRSTCSSSSRLSVKRQEAAAELAATEATLKVMEEMDRERNELENLEVENRQRLPIQEVENAQKLKALEQKRRELERLETIKKMNAAKARLKVYEQGINSDEEISDLLHDNVEQRKAAPKPGSLPELQLTPSQPIAKLRRFSAPQQITRNATQEDSTTALARALAESINISRLPVPEPAVFNGDPLKYKDWQMSFQTLIDRKTIPVN